MDLSNLDAKVIVGMTDDTCKTIKLFGGTWRVPKDTRYVTVDLDGEVHTWKSYDPAPCYGAWVGDTLGDYLGYLGTIAMKPEYDWTEMIMGV